MSNPEPVVKSNAPHSLRSNSQPTNSQRLFLLRERSCRFVPPFGRSTSTHYKHSLPKLARAEYHQSNKNMVKRRLFFLLCWLTRHLGHSSACRSFLRVVTPNLIHFQLRCHKNFRRAKARLAFPARLRNKSKQHKIHPQQQTKASQRRATVPATSFIRGKGFLPL